MRDLNRVLAAQGAALHVAGSTNPQSIGGLIATDVDGTGRDHGLFSERLLSLRIVDADGKAATFRRGDDVLHAAIGGCRNVWRGDRCRDLGRAAYNLAKAVKVVPRTWAEANLEALLVQNMHLSSYYFGGLVHSASATVSPGWPSCA